jgi:hypothetical protein
MGFRRRSAGLQAHRQGRGDHPYPHNPDERAVMRVWDDNR